MRPGTLNVPGIVGFGMACEICAETQENEAIHLAQWRNQLENALLKIPGTRVNGAGSPRLPHTSNITFPLPNGDLLLRSMPTLALSQGSACTSATIMPSHVLLAMGLSEEQALASIRIGLGRFTTREEVEIAIETIQSAVTKIHSMPA